MDIEHINADFMAVSHLEKNISWFLPLISRKIFLEETDVIIAYVDPIIVVAI
jgi:hypothetical protein